MRCAACGHLERAGAAFCSSCGASLGATCSACDAPIPLDAPFCPGCGSATHISAELPFVPARLRDGERRRLTVVFCDLVSSTAMSERLDPEEYRALVREYQTTCAGEIDRFRGHVGRYMGDGLLVYFGYPHAYDDDAARAVEAALSLRDALGPLRRRVAERYGETLHVRIGIHTGLVVVGEMGAGERTEHGDVIGETPNVSARLQALAEPDGILISEETRKLIGDRFVLDPLGPQTIRGLSRTVEAFAVRELADAEPQVAPPAGTPLVGRGHEISLLRRLWAETRDGAGRVVLIRGEPGIGKSRLCRELSATVASANGARLEARCALPYQSTPFFPLIELVRRSLGIERMDGPQERRRKLADGLAEVAPSDARAATLLASLLAIPEPADATPLDLSAEAQRAATVDLLLDWVVQLSAQRPVLLIVEDLHWVDPSSLEVVARLVDLAPQARLLVAFTARPEFAPPWPRRSHTTELTLNRLERVETLAMIEHLLGERSQPDDLRGQIADRSDGVPLFVEEVARALSAANTVGVPETLHDCLMSRLDRLGAAKSIAQCAAVIGREFSLETLRAVAGEDQQALAAGLASLRDAEMVHLRGGEASPTYAFKHALIQEAAYESLLRSTRRELHRSTAAALIAQSEEFGEPQPELIAFHAEAGGDVETALRYWEVAGRSAVERSAYEEAIAHFQRGLAVLAAKPAGPERDGHELAFQVALAAPLLAARGYGSADLGVTYGRARALTDAIGESRHTFGVIRGQLHLHLARAEYARALELGEDLLVRATRIGHPALELGAHFALAQTFFFLGAHAPAEEHFARAWALYDPRAHAQRGSRAGQDPGVSCLAAWGVNQWLRGEPREALATGMRAIDLAHDLGHPISLAFAYHYHANVRFMARDPVGLLPIAEAMATLSQTHRLAQWMASSTLFLHWARHALGQSADIAALQDGVDRWRGQGSEVAVPFQLYVVADAYRRAGALDAAAERLDEALDLAQARRERYWQAAIHQARGELCGTRGEALAARKEFDRAFALATELNQPLLRLRAATALVRLHGAGRAAEEMRRTIRALLRGYEDDSFADLGEARAELTRAVRARP